MQRPTSESAFSLIEMTIAVSVSVLMMASLLSMSAQTSQFVARSGGQFNVQMEGSRTFFRLTEILRKSGRVELDGIVYPRVTSGGAALEFRVLKDLDGNGYFFDASTGDPEWDPLVYEVAVDVDGNLAVHQGGALVQPLGRSVDGLRFETIRENPALHLREVGVEYDTRRPVDALTEAIHSTRGVIVLRN